LRIVVACAQFPPSRSGYARVAGRLAQEFGVAGHTVELITESLGCARVGRIHRLTHAGRATLRGRPDIVQVVGPSPLFTEQVVGETARLGLPCVYKADAFPGLSTYYPGAIPALVDGVYVRTLLAKAMRSVNCAVYSTRDFAQTTWPRPDRWSVIPLGVDDPCLSGRSPTSARPADPSDGTLRVLFVGQLREYKGVTFLLQAVRALRRTGSTIRLTVVGEGPLRAELEASSTDLRSEGAVEFRGLLGDAEVHSEYLTHDVLVLPSLQADSYGLVLLEAGMHGMKVVASDLPGVREVVGELGGVVVRPGDPLALADALRRSGSSGRVDHEVNRGLAARHSWSTIAAEYVDLYEAVLNGSTAPSKSEAPGGVLGAPT
jgi:glycosyltransferase involved in cell wall biosynthesis